MIIILFILGLIVMFKATGFFLKLCGKLLGAMFSFAGYALIGSIVVGAIGLGALIIPIVMIAGLFSIISHIANPA